MFSIVVDGPVDDLARIEEVGRIERRLDRAKLARRARYRTSRSFHCVRARPSPCSPEWSPPQSRTRSVTAAISPSSRCEVRAVGQIEERTDVHESRRRVSVPDDLHLVRGEELVERLMYGGSLSTATTVSSTKACGRFGPPATLDSAPMPASRTAHMLRLRGRFDVVVARAHARARIELAVHAGETGVGLVGRDHPWYSTNSSAPASGSIADTARAWNASPRAMSIIDFETTSTAHGPVSTRAGHGRDRRVKIVERDDGEHAMRRQRIERDFDGFHQRERSFGPGEELRHVRMRRCTGARAGSRRRDARASRKPGRAAASRRSRTASSRAAMSAGSPPSPSTPRRPSVGQDHVESMDVVDRRAVHDRVRAAGVRRRHAADRALTFRRRVGAEVQADLRCLLVERPPPRARLHARDLALGVDPLDGVERASSRSADPSPTH